MRVVIPDWLVVDEEIAVPAPGVVLRALGMRLHEHTGVGEVPKDHETITGRVMWHRRDDVNRLLEMAIDTGEWGVLTQANLVERRGAHLAVGQTVALTGWLEGVAEYEYSDFALPDVRTEWVVESAAQNGETREWHVDLVPAP